MKKTILFILILLCSFAAHADEQVDSLINEFNQKIEAQEYNYDVFMMVYDIGNQLAAENLDKVFEFTNKIQELASRINSDTLRNILLLNFAKIYRYQGFYDKAIENYAKGAYFIKDADPGAYGWNLIHIGNIYFHKELMNEAIQKYKTSIKVYEDLLIKIKHDSIAIINYNYALAVAYNNIGLCKMASNNLKEAGKNFDIAKIYREKTGIKTGMAYQYYYNARINMAENENEEAFKNIDTALSIINLAISESKQDVFGKTVAKTEILFLETELYFKNMNNLDAAYSIFDEIILIFNKMNNIRDRLFLTLKLAEWELDRKLYPIAKRRLLSIQKETEKSKYNNIKKKSLLLLARLYEETNEFSKANKLYRKHKLYQDSISFIQDSIDFRWVEQSVDNEMKARQIELMEKSKLLNQERLKKQNVLIIFLISIFVFILIIVYIILKSHSRNIEANKILAQSERDLKFALDTKDKFFSIIAHDLKNPIISFSGSLEMLNRLYEEISDEEKKEFINELDKSSTHILELLDNLLIWSRAQNDKIPFELQKVNAFKLSEYVTDLLKNFAKDKSVKLKNKIPEELEIVADANMLQTILRNLISNAIKFSYEGSDVEIGFYKEGKKNIFYVKDYGAGIPEDKVDDIFKIDNTYTTPGTNQEKGTGLGLILCKEFVLRHNGEIWIESKVEQGTTVFFTLN